MLDFRQAIMILLQISKLPAGLYNLVLVYMQVTYSKAIYKGLNDGNICQNFGLPAQNRVSC
jgi:hypothetical protein